jgi:predicted dinucleotide-binding enzyme
MRVGVMGTGIVGRTLSEKLAALGHDVMIGTRDVGAVMVAEPGRPGQESFADWHGRHPEVAVGTFEQAGAHGELLVNATFGGACLDALRAAGEPNLEGKILVDTSNPLDFSKGFPPTLSVANTDSLGEQIQRAFPAARVVKTLNTVTAAVMVEPAAVAGGDHHVFVSGDDEAAKAEVTGILRAGFGWRHVIDLGDITTARGTEMYLALWVRLIGVVGSAMFNVKLVQ